MTYLTEIQPKKDDKPIEEEDDPDEVIFDQSPVRVNCPRCGLNIITFIEHESSWVTYAACAVLFLVLGWAALCIVPIIFPLFKDVVHHCPRCLSVLATRSRVVLPSFRLEVMSFRFGSCVVVLARKYVLMLVALTSVIGGIHFVRTSGGPRTGIDAVIRGPFVESTWADYSTDCGFKSFLGNPIHVTMAFKQKYENKTIRWEGEVHHVEDGLTFLWFNQKGSLYVRMFPPQFPKKPALPDLVLLYDDRDPISKEVLRTKRGMNVSFDATMVEVGKRGNPHVMVLWELRQLSGAISGALPRALPAPAPPSKEGNDDISVKTNRSSDTIIQPP